MTTTPQPDPTPFVGPADSDAQGHEVLSSYEREELLQLASYAREFARRSRVTDKPGGMVISLVCACGQQYILNFLLKEHPEWMRMKELSVQNESSSPQA